MPAPPGGGFNRIESLKNLNRVLLVLPLLLLLNCRAYPLAAVRSAA
jgi:hypothetical protein